MPLVSPCRATSFVEDISKGRLSQSCSEGSLQKMLNPRSNSRMAATTSCMPHDGILTSEADIAKAYRSLALRYHPDKNRDKVKDAEVGFKRISEAYSVLRDPQKRVEYDRTGGTRSYVSYDEAEQMWRQFSGQDGEEAPEDARANNPELQSRRKAMAIVLVIGVFLLAPNLLIQVLPGLTAAVVGGAAKRDQYLAKQ
eukprot:s3435_g3.t1